MKTQQFLEKLQDELEEDETLTLDTKLKELESYDSMAILSLMVFVDENFGKKLDSSELKDVETISELKQLIGSERFEN